MFFSSKKKPCLWKGIAAGLAAGLVATIVMDEVQKAITRSTNEIDRRQRLAKGESEGSITTDHALQEKEAVDEANSTGRVARAVSHAVTGHILTADEEKKGSGIVHYCFGTSMGVLYGVMAEYLPESTAGGGVAFGTLLWLGADETAVPALGFAAPPQKVPIASHANHWALHIAYGSAAELVRSLVRRLL